MSKLNSELQRLDWLGDNQADSATPGRIAADGTTHSLAVDFARAADWAQVANLYQGLRDDLELPAPAVSVSGNTGYRLWLALAEPTPVAEATQFLDALCGKYLAELPAKHFRCHPAGPTAGENCPVEQVPALDATTGKWSAFIDPGMGDMFIEDGGLEMAPNLDRQADMLAGIKSIRAVDFQRALTTLLTPENAVAAATGQALPAPAAHSSTAPRHAGSHYSDPQSFLLAVMNDPAASTSDRIAAAKALLPHFSQAPSR